jgi:hypothetical protein
MKRREFLLSAGAVTPAVAAVQRAPVGEDPVEKQTAPPKPAIAMNHLGFLPRAPKTFIFRLTGGAAPAEFTVRDIGSSLKPFRVTKPLRKAASDFGECMVGDFSDVEQELMLQASAGGERSVPFFVRPDVWRRTLPKAVSYHRAQRCGVAVPNVHAACHLDDARRRDNGQYVDLTGGWHDAGDLRKWMDATMMNAFGLLHLARNLGEGWDLGGSGLAPIHEEVKWGNRYFLKMQDSDGLVWADVGGGVGGDNSDNHWTDNVRGNADDRYLNPNKSGLVQAMWVTLQAMVAQEFKATDPGYAQACLDAAMRCWRASKHEGSTRDLSWWALAATEMFRATGAAEYAEAAAAAGGLLLGRQNATFEGGQKQVRGFFLSGTNARAPYAEAVYSALPPLALITLAAQFPKHADAARWRDAVRMHLEEYILPMTSRSVYRIVPFGVFFGSPTKENYRPLAGELTYRYFLPCRQRSWWLGTTSHLECYAALLGEAAQMFGKQEYKDLAYRQLEWVMGANPFAACLMTGEGMRNPYPHSRYVGLIIGGIMNGIAGNANDEPILDLEYAIDWRTAEYWSPHNAFYLWANSVLERG